nr:dnaJ homolog subfamily C member 9-like [Parasteatoda tepidariorum]
MSLLKDCEKYFSTKNLYHVLGIEKGASQLDIKKAYKKTSLIIHPDRNKSQEATRKFQIMAKVHFILSDIEKRAAYDEIGLIDEENSFSENNSTPEFWEQYWKNLFPRITTEDIEAFLYWYKESEEFIRDLKECYLKYEGDMNKLSQAFIGYDVNDEDRLKNILTNLIHKNEIPLFGKFMKESKRKKEARIKRFKSEAKEAAKVKEEMESNLVTTISRRKEEREKQFKAMILSLEAKYGDKKAKRKRKKR